MKALWSPAYSSVWRVLAAWVLFLPAMALADDLSTSKDQAKAATDEKLSPTAVRKPGDCELILEGKYIESLSLLDPLGNTKVIKSPGSSMFLPPGRYVLEEVHLESGCSAWSHSDFTLTPDKPCRLNIGAPLKSSLAVKRDGRLLKLDYQLCDAGERNYSNSDRSNPPEFAVYQGDEKIGSGKFAYG